MNINLRRNRTFLFLLSAALEIGGLGITILMILTSSCVRGKEISLYVNIYMLGIGAVVVVDAVFLLLGLCLRTLGTDSLAVVLHYVLAVICFISGIALILNVLSTCGDITHILLAAAGGATVFSGIIHIFHGILVYKTLALEERHWPERRRDIAKKTQNTKTDDKKAKKENKK